MSRVALALVVAGLTACGSYSTYKTTRIAKPGHTEWLAGLQVSGAGTANDAPAGPANAPLPEIALGARRAVHDRVEVQANGTLLAVGAARTGSLELAGKVRLAERGRWSLATGAGTGYRIAAAGGAIIEGVYVSAPLIAGIELGRHQLVLAVTGGYQRWYSSGARPVGIPFIGQSLGFLWQIGRTWALLPEVGTAWSPTQNFMTEDSRLFHVGIAFVWTH